MDIDRIRAEARVDFAINTGVRFVEILSEVEITT
jgi:hypothetical protein